MTYRSDKQIVQDLIPIRLFTVVIVEGIEDPNGEDAKQLLSWLAVAQQDALGAVDQKKAASLVRRALRVIETLKQPFVEASASVAKFGLVVFYFLDKLRAAGAFSLVDDSAFDKAVTAILSPDGTVTEMANRPKVDASAQKQGRHMLRSIQAEGYFHGVVWE